MKTMTREDWLVLHGQAWALPRPGFEKAIRDMFMALESYAMAMRQRFDGAIGDDYVVGPAWLDMARGLLALLNGETGRFDCGTIDRMVRELARVNGFTESDL